MQCVVPQQVTHLLSEAIFCPDQLQSLLHIIAVCICGALMSSCTSLIMLVSLLKGHQHQVVNSCWLGCIPPASHTKHFLILSATVPCYTVRHLPVIPKLVACRITYLCNTCCNTQKHTVWKHTVWNAMSPTSMLLAHCLVHSDFKCHCITW